MLLALAILAMIANAAGVCFLFANAGKLGVLFCPALLLYSGALLAVQYRILRRRELQWLRCVLDEEQFYAQFPRERKKAERRAAASGKRREHQKQNQ